MEAASYQPCIIRLLGTNEDKDPALLRRFQELCRQILSRNSSCYYARNYAGDIIAVYCLDETDSPEDSFSILLNQCLETVKNKLPVSPYVLLGSCVENYWEVSASFREAIRGGIHLDSIAAGEAAAAKKEESNASSPFPSVSHSMCWSIMIRIYP